MLRHPATLLGTSILLLAGAASAAPSGDDPLWFWNGDERIELTVDPTRFGVQFAEGVHEARAREILRALEFLAAGEADGAYLPLVGPARVAAVPGLSAEDALGVARAVATLPEVVAAGPVLLALEDPYYLTDEVVVRWRADASSGSIAALEAFHGLEPVASIDYTVNPGVRYRLPHGRSLDAIDITVQLHETGLTEFAHPNWSLTRVLFAETNDPLFAQQWHLNSTGQGGAKPDADVDAMEAWDITRGDPSIIVAVVDTGVELGHPDLDLVQGIDVLANDNNPAAEDGLFGGIFGFTESHATSVAGVACGKGNNGIGTTGAAQLCRAMPIRYLSDANLFAQPSANDAADAFNFAVNNGAAIINNSWGPAVASPLPAVTKAAIDNATTNGRGGLGTLVVFASGNSSASADTNGYSAYIGTLGIAASNDQDLQASYSNFGQTIDVCAPSNGGVTPGIGTTDRLGAKGYSLGDYTDTFGGTSSAAPLVCGVAALVLSVNPNLTWTQVRQILQGTADKIDPAGGNYNASGHSIKYGFGKVNARAAVDAAAGGGGCTAPVAYGAPDLSTQGNTATISASGGDPSVSNPSFTITLSGANPNQGTILVESAGQDSLPTPWGTLLVASPFIRHPGVSSATGTDSYPVPMTAAMIGQTRYWQWVIRDPGAGAVAHHSGGLQVTFCP